MSAACFEEGPEGIPELVAPPTPGDRIWDEAQGRYLGTSRGMGRQCKFQRHAKELRGGGEVGLGETGQPSQGNFLVGHAPVRNSG